MVDLRVLTAPIAESLWPRLPCPTCDLGVLNAKHFDGLRDAVTKRASEKHPGFDPDWITGVFSGVLECGNADCAEMVVVTGDYTVGAADGPDLDGTWSSPYENYFLLRYANPALRVIVPPKGTPEPVVLAIQAASKVIWTDPSAAGNRLRFAVEELLTAKGISEIGAKGNTLRTHARIELFEKVDPVAADVLMSVKWVGNTGSHEASLTVEDVLDSADRLDLALRLIFDTRDSGLLKQASAINAHKGLPPRSSTP